MDSDDLSEAARQNDVNALYAAISEDPHILNNLDKRSFIDTPFHIAASLGHTHFAIEIMMLRPSFARKLNQNGDTPMHVAIKNNHDNLVRGLLAKDKDLVRAYGREGITPLHCLVVRKVQNDANTLKPTLLQEMLSASPESLEDLTVKRETALHLAVKHKRFEAFKYLVECIQKSHKEKIYGWKDEDGNTALHLATRGSEVEMIQFLFQKYKYKEWNLKVEVQDDNNKTAIDLAKDLPEADPNKDTIIGTLVFGTKEGMTTCCSLRTRYFRYVNNQLSKAVQEISPESQEALLVVLALIVTTTFQVGVNPPGSFWQDDGDNHVAGTPILATTNPILYFLMSLFTMAGFASSLSLIVVLTMGLPLKNLLLLATTFLSGSYIVSFWSITRKLLWVVGATLGSISLLLAFTFVFYVVKFMRFKIKPALSVLSHAKTR
ncbi:hypothetical protein ACHQM5_011177 [Ranunculus cassubicifolius]